jgi:molybdate transport system regulatory protein
MRRMSETDAPDMHALIQSRRNPAARVGPERMALLQAIRELGSISAAARQAGLSYKGAWDAVQALNNLFDTPLVVSQAGGRQGGTARVTEAGDAVLAAFSEVEAALAAVAIRLDQALAGAAGGGVALDRLSLWSLGMKTSARNLFRGVVEAVDEGAVNGEVRLRITDQITLTSIISTGAIAELGLSPGRPAAALINASSIILAVDAQGLRTSARNLLAGTVVSHDVGAVNDEVVLELAPGKLLTATVTRESARLLGLAVGMPVQALIKASAVILAVD